MRSLKHKSFIIVLLLLFLLFVGGLAFVFNAWKVKTIKIEGVPKDTVLYGLNNLANRPLLILSVSEVQKNILNSNPFVAKVQVRKIYPQTLIINISKEKALAYFRADVGYFELNEKGKILRKSKEQLVEEKFPIISYFEKLHFTTYQPGDYIGIKDIEMALGLLLRVSNQGMKVNTIDIDGVDMIGFKLKGKVIIFSSEKDIETQIYQLEQIVHQFKVQGTDFKKLDLRFNRPILELVE